MIPQEPGVYWARRKNQELNLIVHVGGEAPFLRILDHIDLWQPGLMRSSILTSSEIEEWGPRIEEPGGFAIED
jgi:hypothetical protein